MKKINRLSLVILFMSLLLLGCQQQDNSLDVKEEIKEVYVFRSTEFKKDKSDFIISSSETGNTKVFETVKNILSDATEQDGVVDTIEPNYYLEIIYKDQSTRELFLWLVDVEDGKGSFMEVEDTHTMYNFSEELNVKLINLIEN